MHRAAYSLSVVVAAGVLAGAQPAAAQSDMAVVDVRRAMEATNHWKDAYGKLEKERQSRQALIEAKKVELQEKRDALEAKKAVSDPKAVAQEEEVLYTEAQRFMRAFQVAQQQLTMMEQQLTEQMLTRIEAVVKQLSLEKGYDFVFEAGLEGEPNVLYAKKGVDITGAVVKLYKKAYAGKPLKEPERPQVP